MYIVTTAQMQAAERAADAWGLSYDEMMENAGYSVALAIEAQFDLADAAVLVLVGPGNNGGDGLVVARYLDEMGAAVTVYVWKRQTEGDKNWARLDNTNVTRIIAGDTPGRERLTELLHNSDIIIDALLGTGAARPIEGPLAELLDQVKRAVALRRRPVDGPLVNPAQPTPAHELNPVVVAVDLPSGLNSDTGEVDPHTLPADLTVSMAAVKRGHILLAGPTVTGQLVVGDIGLLPTHYPPDVTLEMATGTKVAKMLPPRPVGAHKGTFGTAMLVAGSSYYTGAALLAGRAAGRAGAGLVAMALPRTIHPIVASALAEAIYWPLPDEGGAIAPAAVPTLREAFANRDSLALLIGPGLSQAGPTVAFLQALLADPASLPPLILDADALNILARQNAWWQGLPPGCILTPHLREMARLMKSTVPEIQANRLEVAAEMAAKWGQILLLKGAYTLVAAPDGRLMALPFANPALAKGGSGDVLAGTIVALRAQGLPPFEAAVAGAYLHGLAGALARQELGVAGVIAGDLISRLPTALRAVGGEPTSPND